MTALGRATAACVALGFLFGACAPIVPQRSKPGGAARWAEQIAISSAFDWGGERVQLCRVTGAGVGAEGWLPDRGGQWAFTYWSPAQTALLQVTVDSDGNVKSAAAKDGPRGTTLPPGWVDSPKLWAATRSHQKREPLNTLDAELSASADPEHFKDQVVWRIRFWLDDSTMETHIVTPDGKWLLSY